MKTFYNMLVFALCVSFTGSAISQTDSVKYQTDEIIVTGTRVEQKIIDIPFSVQRIDKELWKSSRQQGLNDVLTSVPGLFLQSRYGNHDVRVTIRGFGSRSNTGIRGVRILLDGIPESEPDGQTRVEALDFTAIGKIELVKGNSSSLYTNAPGGVINFFSDKFFPGTFALLDNEFGSYDLRKNALKFGLNSANSRFMLTSSYENYKGYRDHSQEYQTRVNSIFETNFTRKSVLTLYGYYVSGLIKIPGSLTLTNYNTNDTMANPRDKNSRDSKRVTKKGRLGMTYNTRLGKEDNHVVEVTAYGTIKDLERTAKTYRIFARYGIGSSFRYINKLKFGERTNEFSVGGDLYYQTGPVSEFVNNAGESGAFVSLSDETISNVGFYATDQVTVIKDRVSLLLTGRYDRVNFKSDDQSPQQFRDTTRLFDQFTPKASLNFKLTRNIAFYTSYGLGFDSPAANEMDNYPTSTDPNVTINPDLMAQKSNNFEAGIKGDLPGLKDKYFKNTFVELTFFSSKIKDEIVPFNVDGTVYYRNAGSTQRNGLEFGVSSEIIKGLSLKAAYTYSDFKYKDYTAHFITTIPGFKDSVVTYNNNIVPSVPKNLFSGDLAYQYVIQKKYTLFAKVNFQYVDKMFVDDFNTDSLKTAPYALLNAQIGASINIGSINVLAYAGINNIADKKYVGFININSDKYEFYEAGPHRNFFGGLTLGYMFR